MLGYLKVITGAQRSITKFFECTVKDAATALFKLERSSEMVKIFRTYYIVLLNGQHLENYINFSIGLWVSGSVECGVKISSVKFQRNFKLGTYKKYLSASPLESVR